MKIRDLYKYLLVFLVIGLCSCQNSYQKLLKSSDYELKLEKAKFYYNRGDYVKAIPLFEELIGIFKGTRDVEDLYYFYPYCYFGQGDYQFSAYYFKNFLDYYPKSSRAETARFMTAYCYYKLSPDNDLAQDNTMTAIEAFQLFANNYPKSERVAEVNGLIDELRGKLEVKALNAAELYYNMREYRAAVKAYTNLLYDFPDTNEQEKVNLMILKSYYLFADNSIYEKQEERYNQVVESYLDFIKAYPESKYLREAESFYNESSAAIEKIKTEPKKKQKFIGLPIIKQEDDVN